MLRTSWGTNTGFFLVLVLCLLFGAASSMSWTPRGSCWALSDDDPAAAPAMTLAQEEPSDEEGEKDEGKDEGKKEGKEEGKEEGKAEGDSEDDGSKVEKGTGSKRGYKGDAVLVTPEEMEALTELQMISPLELDSKSPKFISKTAPPFVVVRPAGAKTPKTSSTGKGGKASKETQVDGSRWGFVDMAMRKKRLGGLYDKLVEIREKIVSDEKASEEDRTRARKEANRLKAVKVQELKKLDKVRCWIELSGNEKVSLQIRSEERTLVGGEKNFRDAVKQSLQGDGFRVSSETPEFWRGNKKVPGCTVIAERQGSGKGNEEELWLRQTYFIVPTKTKGGGMSIFFFDCFGPKSQVGDRVKNEFDAFIKGTQLVF